MNPETKDKLRKLANERAKDPEYKRKLREARKKQKITVETRLKMSQAHLGLKTSETPEQRATATRKSYQDKKVFEVIRGGQRSYATLLRMADFIDPSDTQRKNNIERITSHYSQTGMITYAPSVEPYENNNFPLKYLSQKVRRVTAAYKQVLVRYQPLVITRAEKLVQQTETIDDLIGDAQTGLMKATARFDPSRGTPFGSFVTPYIDGAIKTSRIKTQTIRYKSYDNLTKVWDAQSEFFAVNGFYPDNDHLSTLTGLSDSQIQSTQKLAARSNLSLEHEPTLDASIPDFSSEVVDADTARSLLVNVEEALTKLPQMLKEIVIARFHQGMTLENASQHFGISARSIGRYQDQAINLLRELLLPDRMATKFSSHGTDNPGPEIS